MDTVTFSLASRLMIFSSLLMFINVICKQICLHFRKKIPLLKHLNRKSLNLYKLSLATLLSLNTPCYIFAFKYCFAKMKHYARVTQSGSEGQQMQR